MHCIWIDVTITAMFSIQLSIDIASSELTSVIKKGLESTGILI